MSFEEFTRGFCVPRDVFVDGTSVNSEHFDCIAESAIAKLVGTLKEEPALKGDYLLKEIRPGGDYSRQDLVDDVISILSRRTDDNQTYQFDHLPAAFAGYQGYTTLLFLKSYLARRGELPPKLLGAESKCVDPARYRNKLCGQLKDFVFVEEGESGGHRVGSGHLSADVFEEEYCTDESFLACKPDKITLIHWDIEISSGSFVIHERDDSNFPDTPFPTLPGLDFPDHALDPGDARSLWCRGLNRKLFAKGREIKIHKVYRQICEIDAAGKELEGQFELIGKGHPDYDLYYTTTENSCVDIMFKGDPPSTQLPPQVEYCMGRCESPPIVNSGGG